MTPSLQDLTAQRAAIDRQIEEVLRVEGKPGTVHWAARRVLQEHGYPMTTREIADEIGRPPQAVGTIMRRHDEMFEKTEENLWRIR